jgi:hypothetical protein
LVERRSSLVERRSSLVELVETTHTAMGALIPGCGS